MTGKTIKAGEGKVFRRVSDGMIYGDELTFGYTYFINGEKLEEPHLDILSDFEEIDVSEIPNL